MSERFKNLIRWILFYLPLPDEWIAEPGTFKYRLSRWLYGPGEPEFDCIMPEDRQAQ